MPEVLTTQAMVVDCYPKLYAAAKTLGIRLTGLRGVPNAVVCSVDGYPLVALLLPPPVSMGGEGERILESKALPLVDKDGATALVEKLTKLMEEE